MPTLLRPLPTARDHAVGAPRPRRRLAAMALVAVLTAGCSSATDVAATPGTSPSTAPSAASAVDGSATPGTASGETVLLDEMPALHPSVDDYPRGTVVLEAPDGARVRLQVLVAATPAHRSHGLMEVPDLPDGAGMAFVFEQDVTSGFWMKNTLVPLDIAYVAADGGIVSTTSMVPCPEGEACPSYPADGPYRMAVEVPEGFWGRIGLDADWTVTLEQA